MATSACARPPTKATKSKAKSPSKCAPCPPTANPPTRVRLGQPDPGSFWPNGPGFGGRTGGLVCLPQSRRRNRRS
jgi:hypothetical protein